MVNSRTFVMWSDLSTYPVYLLQSHSMASFRDFPCTNKNQTLLKEKSYSSVCLYSFVFPHRGSQATAHAILCVTLVVSFLSYTLSTTLVFGLKIPQQFTVSARKSSNNCTDKLSVYN
jgi:hypothetical protein